MSSVETLAEVVEWLSTALVASRRTVVFTGAGVSTESGIPDFRSPGGLWEQNAPIAFQDFLYDEAQRVEYWRRSRNTFPVMAGARPNLAHQALAELYRLGLLDRVITQNIDNLHQRAGVPAERVIELHGTAMWVRCLDCERRWPSHEIYPRLETGEAVPRCESCGGLLKPATISFGQAMPEVEMREAENRARAAELFLVIGSSLVVYPAAFVPHVAADAGARLALINLTPTDLDERAQVVVRAKAAETMEPVMARVRALVAERSAP